MALQVRDQIQGARDRHPAFNPRDVPNGICLRWLTNYQRSLVARICQHNQDYLAQQASIVLRLDTSDGPSVAGAGSRGGLPVSPGGGATDVLLAPAGGLVDFDLENAVVAGGDFVPTAVGDDTVDYPGGWVVNEHAGRFLYVAFGPGAGCLREIDSNIDSELTLLDAWTPGEPATIYTSADAPGSVCRILIMQPRAAGDPGVVLALPPTATKRAYLVKLNSGGVPYIDLTDPILATFDAGISLPPHQFILGGTVRWTTDQPARPPEDIQITNYGQRYDQRRYRFGAYVLNGQLYLQGAKTLWQGVVGLDLRYAPIAPDVVSLDDYLLVPDDASPAVQAQLALFMAKRFRGTLVSDTQVEDMKGDAVDAEATYLATVIGDGRATVLRTQDVT